MSIENVYQMLTAIFALFSILLWLKTYLLTKDQLQAIVNENKKNNQDRIVSRINNDIHYIENIIDKLSIRVSDYDDATSWKAIIQLSEEMKDADQHSYIRVNKLEYVNLVKRIGAVINYIKVNLEVIKRTKFSKQTEDILVRKLGTIFYQVHDLFIHNPEKTIKTNYVLLYRAEANKIQSILSFRYLIQQLDDVHKILNEPLH